MSSVVAVTIVTYNSARFIGQCLESVFGQDLPRIEVVVVDNASTDETADILREWEGRARILYNRVNVGFAAGQNQAIANSSSEWVLILNPDVRLQPNFVSMLVAAGGADAGIGTVCGKLLRIAADFSIPERAVFDSTGIYFTPALRHLDRGSGMADDGRYDRVEYVFGATGAAALYRRRMIEDVSVFGEFFDSDFFAYREDADVAWRAQLLGWKCVYTPFAVGYHVRSVLAEERGRVAPAINMHSVKNRWLMRIKNTTPKLYARHFLAITGRDFLVIGGCLAGEWRSLKAFPLVIRMWRRTWRKRREIMRRRRVGDAYIEAWFSFEPVSFAAPEIAAKCALLC